MLVMQKKIRKESIKNDSKDKKVIKSILEKNGFNVKKIKFK